MQTDGSRGNITATLRVESRGECRCEPTGTPLHEAIPFTRGRLNKIALATTPTILSCSRHPFSLPYESGNHFGEILLSFTGIPCALIRVIYWEK